MGKVVLLGDFNARVGRSVELAFLNEVEMVG